MVKTMKQKAEDAKKKVASQKMFASSIKANDKDLKKISSLTAQYEALEGERNALLAAAEELWKQILELQRKKLPAAFAEAGVKDFTDAGSGAVLELDNYLSGTWPKGGKPLIKALKWIAKVKAENLIKVELIAKYGRDDAAKARKEALLIQKTGKATVEVKERIHPQTLLSFFRERLKKGLAVPFDLFEGETGTYVKVSFPSKGEEDGSR